jgi:hypothetical protein
MQRMRARYLVCLGLALAAVGCAPNEEEVKADWKKFLGAHQACTADSDCALVHPGCPLACASPVAVDAVAAGERLARDLIEDYESGGRSCDYDCVLICGAACQANQCVTVAPPADGGVCPR